MGKNILLWLIILAVLLTVFNNFEGEPKQQPMAYSEFIDAVERGDVREATIQDNKITATDGAGETFTVTGFQYDPRLVQILDENRVRIDVKPPETQSIFTQILVASFPILIILAVAIFFMRQMQGGGGGRGGRWPLVAAKQSCCLRIKLKQHSLTLLEWTRQKKMSKN